MRLSIVIPCFNEADNIPLVLDRFSKVIGKRNISVVIVNNGSTDNSAEIIDELVPKYPFAETVLVEKNRGYGYGIVQGLKYASGDYIGWTHADMQTDPGDVVKAYDLIIKNAPEQIYVKGTRRGRPLFDRIFTNGMGRFESLFFGKKLYDINAQPNVFPRSFFESWDNPPDDFSLDLFSYYLAKKNGLRVIRYSVRFPERIHGVSKWNTDGLKSKWKFIKRTVSYSIKLKKKMKKNG